MLLGSFHQGDANADLEITAFREAIAAAGWNEATLQIEYRWGGGNPERIQVAAEELTKANLEVIVTRSSPATTAVLRNTSTTPVVFVQLVDPVKQGFVRSYAKPGTNATGFTNVEASMPTKWLSLVKEMLPDLRHVTILYNIKTTVDSGRFFLSPLEAAAPAFGLTTKSISVQTLTEIENAIGDAGSKPQGAIITAPDTFLASFHREIIQLISKHHIPALHPFVYWVRAGGLMCYGIDSTDLFRRAASYVDRILRGTPPGELPVQAPTKFEMVLNLKTAKALGISIPPMLLARADQVIE